MAEGSSYDLVVEFLNQASLERSGASKVILLKQVQELIINKEPNLLDNFFDEVIGFQSDKSVDVRKFVITFLEFACKVDGDILSKIIGNLNILLYDENVNIQKKVMLSMASLYRTAIKWIVEAKMVNEVMEETWKYLSQMRDHIVALLDDDNDGIRTHSAKFCEAVVLVLSPKTPDSDQKADDQSLDIVPDNHGFLKKTMLKEQGEKVFKQMLEFVGSQSITSVNLMACMTSMTTIARRRPQYMTEVIEGFESLHVNLPPTLANSQVSSVRKSLKLQMLSVLKHPSAVDMIPQIATLLTDLGATQTEVNKAMPRPSEVAARRKRKADTEAELQRTKKFSRTEMPALPVLPDPEDDDDDMEPPARPREAPKPLNPVDITTDDIIPRLSSSNVADLVLLSMVMLPDDMPAHFQSTYTPIAAAGTPGQIKHISRLLAVQLSGAGLGKGIEEQRIKEKEEEELARQKEVPMTPAQSSIQVLGGVAPAAATTSQQDLAKAAKAQFMVPMSGTSSRKSRAYDLVSVTNPLSVPVAANLFTMSVQRILKSEAEASKANLNGAFCKIVAGLATQFGGFVKEMLRDFVLSDTKNRGDLALAWVYSEYVAYQGFTISGERGQVNKHGYEECLIGLLQGVLERGDQLGASGLFCKLLLESPHLPSNAIHVLREYCTDEKHMYVGMNTLRELMLKRPVLLGPCLSALLHFTYHEKPEVRTTAIKVLRANYDHPKVTHLIDMFCREMINHLVEPYPLPEMFPACSTQRFVVRPTWNEVFIKQVLYLYLSLLPDKPSYTELLAEVYVKAPSDVKRVILRLMETPIKQLGMDSQELLKFIKNSPKGSETLITRIIHILTERHAPSAELVHIVKDLYQERVADVRFLIPVLGGLHKSEIIAALPRLIKLTPAIVKEVFNRLLGVGGHTGQEAAITPSELMVALHHIEPSLCEIKVVIKATTMCFQEKSLFTQEVLAVVIQQLMDDVPLPTLFMRTVIQSLTMYPKLLGFVLNILQRLITKQVWKQKKVWEGFVRCCQRAKPQSFQVLLQLPPPQLRMVFETAPDLRSPLLKHINNFSAHQRAHIPKAVLAAIEQQETVEVIKVEPVVVKAEPPDRKIQSEPAAPSEPVAPGDSTEPGEVADSTPMSTPTRDESTPTKDERPLDDPNLSDDIVVVTPTVKLAKPMVTKITASGDKPRPASEPSDSHVATPGANLPSKEVSVESESVDLEQAEPMETTEATVASVTDEVTVSDSQTDDSAADITVSSSDITEVSAANSSCILLDSEDNPSLATESSSIEEIERPNTTQGAGARRDTEEQLLADESQQSTDESASVDVADVKESAADDGTQAAAKSPAKRGRKKVVASTPAATRKSSRRKK